MDADREELELQLIDAEDEVAKHREKLEHQKRLGEDTAELRKSLNDKVKAAEALRVQIDTQSQDA